MVKLAKKPVTPPLTPADIAQVTILVDSSDSMGPMKDEVRRCLARVVKEFQARDGMVLAIKSFNTSMKTISDFGEVTPQVIPYDVFGGTALARAISQTIKESRDDAELTPEIKSHHVIVAITDGEDLDSSSEEIDQAKLDIEAIDVNATFILLDLSEHGKAGRHLGLKGIRFNNNSAEFQEAMKKVSKAIGQIADNIIKQLAPKTGLCLPPAR